ncbi:hypothetical protein C4K68_10175 [Pokkaliibacter plantistimulans]|uniref:Phasin domain-containing protein n=1 Tax=Proteobacteria bacterium 228 TaxID=2083153 RepID=A0A2S5KRU7_9PROT|nr:phasin family protein [Pokkaliibacter plantistimulans]PPC77450.1 hypothetical protein C4K68_10175 [Pokkaliibacter plantistimulans]
MSDEQPSHDIKDLQDRVQAEVKTNVESSLALAMAAMNTLQRLSSLHLRNSQQMLESSGKIMLNDLWGRSEDLTKLPTWHTHYSNPWLEQLNNYSRDVYELLADHQDDVAEVLKKRAGDLSGSQSTDSDK